jgi:hypothetical protein
VIRSHVGSLSRCLAGALVVACTTEAAPAPAEPAASTAAPAASATPSPDPRAWAACTDSIRCRLVLDPCGTFVGAGFEHVSAAVAAVGAAPDRPCSGPTSSVPIEPSCIAGVCGVRPLDHPELRTCERDDECVMQPVACHRTPIRRDAAATFGAAARSCRAWVPVGPGACRRGVCVDPGWLAPELEAPR